MTEMDLLVALRDVGVVSPQTGDAGDRLIRRALDRELERGSDRGGGTRRADRVRRRGRRVVLVPAIVLLSSAVAAAATVALGYLNQFEVAKNNVLDTPTQVFEANALRRFGPEFSPHKGVPMKPYPETVIPATIREIETFKLAGVGTVQYWVADTKQRGICRGLRLPDGKWAGLQNRGRAGGSMPGCTPTRAQMSGGALGPDPFDDQTSDVRDSSGRPWILVYGIVSTTRGHATEVRETISGRHAPVVDGYFALAIRPVGSDYDGYPLEALDASGHSLGTGF